ncbi:hypothetical protein BJX63DRAFT_433398 [Aspergillus granulosus]|uniref:Uncharacterized protein n=1 Tax=Aspergillus granulosus TaxID=176169 RepID=A0ABR4H7E5_9EURO
MDKLEVALVLILIQGIGALLSHLIKDEDSCYSIDVDQQVRIGTLQDYNLWIDRYCMNLQAVREVLGSGTTTPPGTQLAAKAAVPVTSKEAATAPILLNHPPMQPWPRAQLAGVRSGIRRLRATSAL